MEAEQLANLHILHSYQPNHSPKVPVLRTIKGAGDEIKTMRDLEILLFSKLAMIQCAIFLLQNEHLPRYVRESPDRDQIFLRQFLPRITYLVDAVDYEIEGAKLDGNILFISNQEERLKRLKEVSPDTVSSWVCSLKALINSLTYQHAQAGVQAYVINSLETKKSRRETVSVMLNHHGFKMST